MAFFMLLIAYALFHQLFFFYPLIQIMNVRHIFDEGIRFHYIVGCSHIQTFINDHFCRRCRRNNNRYVMKKTTKCTRVLRNDESK